MRHVPIVVVAMLATMVLTAAALKWRAPRASSSPMSSPVVPGRAPLAGAPRGLGAGPAPGPAASGAARMLHGDPRHTHRSSGSAPTSTPVVAWAHGVGGPIEAQVATSPDERTLYVASLAGTLTALASTDGGEQWTLQLGDRAYATPCVADDGTIFVGSDAKKIVAVSPEGKVKWSLETDGDADTGPTFGNDGTLVFAAGRMVYGVTSLGLVKWRFAAKRKVYTAPAIGQHGEVFFGSQDHFAYALSSDGRPAWSVDLAADVDGAPAVGDDGAVFVGTDGDEIIRLDAADGHVVWRTAVGGYVRGTLSVARDGDVLAGVYGPTPRAVRVRAADGNLLGDFAIRGTGAREFGVHGGPLEDEAGTLVFGAQDDYVYAVDSSGTLLWRFATGGDVDAPVTLLRDGTVVVGSDDGSVRALRTASVHPAVPQTEPPR